MGHVFNGAINASDEHILSTYLTNENLSFFQEYTRAPDEKLRDLAEHILSEWRASVEKIHGYGCIREFLFLKPGIHRRYYYPLILKMNEESKQEMTLCDVGGCFGTDIRKLLVDGFSENQLSVIDVNGDFWDVGLSFFGDKKPTATTESSFKPSPKVSVSSMKTAFTSLADPNFFSKHPDFQEAFDVTHAGLVLHVFDDVLIRGFLSGVKGLLKEGGLFVGWNVGVNDGQEGHWKEFLVPGTQRPRYLQSRTSLAKLLNEEGFVDVEVRFDNNEDFGINQPIVPCDRELLYLSFIARKP